MIRLLTNEISVVLCLLNRFIYGDVGVEPGINTTLSIGNLGGEC